MVDKPLGTGVVSKVAEIIGVLTGAVALIYVLGGMIVAIRLVTLGFSVPTAISTVGLMPKATIATYGFGEVIAPAAIVAFFVAIGSLAFEQSAKRQKRSSSTTWAGRLPLNPREESPRWRLVLACSLLLTAVPFVVAGVVHGFHGWVWLTWASALITVPIVWTATYLMGLVNRRLTMMELASRASNAAIRSPLQKAALTGVLASTMVVVPAGVAASALRFDEGRACLTDGEPLEKVVVLGIAPDRIVLGKTNDGKATAVSLADELVSRVWFGELTERDDEVKDQCPAPAAIHPEVARPDHEAPKRETASATISSLPSP
jgi:hypothetical protein